MNFFLAHKVVIINSLIMAIFIFAPVILFPVLTRDSYQGINVGNFEVDEFQYLAKGREILEGHRLGNVILREGKDWYNIQQTYVEYLFMIPIKLLRFEDKVNVPVVFNAFGFIGSFFLILLIYFFTLQLSGDKKLALAAALFVVGGYTLVTWSRLNLSGLSDSDINIYSRPSVPLYAMVGLFLYLNLLVRSLKSSSYYYHVFEAGLSLGLLFYVYFYGWSFAYALTGILFCIYLFKKDYHRAKKIFLIALAGIFVGFYFFFNLFQISYSEVGQRILLFTVSYGRYFAFSKIAFIALLLVLIFWFKNPKSENWPILLSIALAGWVSLNQQLITGQSLQPVHYFWYFVIPASILVSIFAIWSLLPGDKYRAVFLAVLISAAYANTAFEQYRGLKINMPLKQYAQSYRPIIDYLNQNSQGGVILASDRFYRTMLLVYTPYDLFWNESAAVFNTPLGRFKEALYVYLYLNKESRNDFVGYINKVMRRPSESESPYQNIYFKIENLESGMGHYDYYHRLLADDAYISVLRQKVLPPLYEEYQKIVRQPGGIKSILKNAGVNYIVWDKNRNPEWDLSLLGGIKEVVSSNNIYLYKVEYGPY